MLSNPVKTGRWHPGGPAELSLAIADVRQVRPVVGMNKISSRLWYVERTHFIIPDVGAGIVLQPVAAVRPYFVPRQGVL